MSRLRVDNRCRCAGRNSTYGTTWAFPTKPHKYGSLHCWHNIRKADRDQRLYLESRPIIVSEDMKQPERKVDSLVEVVRCLERRVSTLEAILSELGHLIEHGRD
jgi:hypothetical protein